MVWSGMGVVDEIADLGEKRGDVMWREYIVLNSETMADEMGDGLGGEGVEEDMGGRGGGGGRGEGGGGRGEGGESATGDNDGGCGEWHDGREWLNG